MYDPKYKDKTWIYYAKNEEEVREIQRKVPCKLK